MLWKVDLQQIEVSWVLGIHLYIDILLMAEIQVVQNLVNNGINYL